MTRVRSAVLISTSLLLAVALFGSAPAHAGPAPAASRPVITAIEANSGPTSGHNLVRIFGYRFGGLESVRFGDRPSPVVEPYSTRVLIARVPPHAGGVVDVHVITVNGVNPPAAAARYTYRAPDTAYPVAARVPVGEAPRAIAVDPAAGTGYVSDYLDGAVSVIDEATSRVTGTIRVGRHPTGIAFDPDTRTGYVINAVPAVAVFDGATDAVRAVIPLPGAASDVVVDAGADEAYVADTAHLTVLAIAGADATVAATIPVPGTPTALAVDPSTHSVYVAIPADNTVAVIDTGTNTLTRTITVRFGPSDVAVDPSNRLLYVSTTARLHEDVAVVDTVTGTVVATTPIGQRPALDLAVDTTTHTVYVVGKTNRKIYVLEGTTGRVAALVHVGPAPAGAAVDSVTHVVFVSNHADYGHKAGTPTLTAPLVSLITPVPAS